MTEEEKFQWIDDYVNGKLSTEQHSIFLQELQTDPRLAEQVDLHRDMLIGFEKAIDKELKAHFTQLEQQAVQAEEDKNKKTGAKTKYSFTHRQIYIWVSSIAACLVFGLFLYIFNYNQTKYERLFDKYHDEPYMIGELTRNDDVLSTKKEAIQAYETGYYEQATALFESYLRTTPGEVDCTFYLAMAYIETNKLQKAERYLGRIINQPTNEFTSPAKWYLALIYLKNNKIKEAKSILQALSYEKGFYGKKATLLLEEL